MAPRVYFTPRTRELQPAPDFLSGGGELGERIRAHDWIETPLGTAREWPQELRTAVRIMLASRQPMSIWWGTELTVLYNDACRALIGGYHPAALGQPAPSAWREVWEEMGPRVEGAIRGEGGASKPMALLIERQGRVEEAHCTIGFTTIPGEAGAAGGLLCGINDVTLSVVFDRQMNLLKALATRTPESTTFEKACASAIEGLARGAADIPFAAIYLVDEEAGEARLAASAGIARGHAALPEKQPLGDDDGPWPFAEVIAGTRYHQTMALSESVHGPLPSGPWSRPPREAAVIRLAAAGPKGTHAVLIAAFNPFRVPADDPRRLVELVAAQVSARLCNG